jgi:hypothetical protein
MKEKYNPPCYVAQLPDGERELDAFALFELFRYRQIDSQTLIRPITGGDWRKFSEEPEFIAALPCLRQKSKIHWWSPVFMIFMMALPLPLCFLNGMLTLWPFLFIYMIGYSIAFYFALMAELLDLKPTNRRVVRMLIPWWNCIEIFLLFRDCADMLPKKTRHLLITMAPLICMTYAALITTFYFVPATYNGGVLIFFLYGLLFIFHFICAIPITTELKRRSTTWLTANPKPPNNKLKSQLWSKFNWHLYTRTIIPGILFILVCYVGGIILFLIPCYVIGEIRWQQLPKHELPDLEKPYAGPALVKIYLPELPDRFVPMWKAKCKVPADFKTELKKVAPQLAAIRKILRTYPSLGLCRESHLDGDQPIDKCNRTLRIYRRWRQAELHYGGDILELLRDLKRRTQYATEEPAYGVYYLNFNLRMTLVERYLTKFTDKELACEKAYWKNSLGIVNTTIRQSVFQTGFILSDSFIHKSKEYTSLKMFFFVFGNGMRATIFEYSTELAVILSCDVWQNQADLKAYQVKVKQSGVFIFFSSISADFKYNYLLSRYRAVCLLTPVGIELEEYRRKHGNYPINPSLPVDPFSGKPMLYKKDKAIYSIGPNLKDNNAQPPISGNRYNSDIVFNLQFQL